MLRGKFQVDLMITKGALHDLFSSSRSQGKAPGGQPQGLPQAIGPPNSPTSPQGALPKRKGGLFSLKKPAMAALQRSTAVLLCLTGGL